MEGRVSGGGCCIARYGHHGPSNSYYTYDMSKMDRIMLRFRPIAPKPVVGGSTTGAQNDGVRTRGKGKRKNNGCTTKGGSNGGSSKRRKSRSPEDQKSHGLSKGCMETLPLLPETPDLSPRKDHQVSQNKSVPMWLCFGSSDENLMAPEVVRSSVIVEGVTDTWVDGNGLGRSDEERRRRLDEDTCPAFISDGWNRVWWTNEAYRRMITGVDTWRKERVVVVNLGMRERVELPSVNLYPAFTCRVKVQYGKEGSHSMTIPCDAWRMDGGGFAWKLDIKAALSLGR